MASEKFFSLQGQVAVITGAGQGIGEGIATRLSQAGARVAVLDTNGAAAKEAAQRLRGLGLDCDVRSAASVQQAFDEVRRAELGPPLFFSNSNPDITGDRLRYNLAHELGHIILHRFGIPTTDIEKEADRFASEFLMPSHEIKPYLNRINIPKLAALKREWRVSMGALIQKAFRLGTITESQRRYLIINLRRSTHSFREPPETDIPIEKPMLLGKLIQAHIHDLGYSVSEMSELVAEFEPNFYSYYMPALKIVSFRGE